MKPTKNPKDCVGWKGLNNNRVARLLIPKGALVRWHDPAKDVGRFKKHRASQALVLAIYQLRSRGAKPLHAREGTAIFPLDQITYKVGKSVHPTARFNMKDVACGCGIHFFLTPGFACMWIGAKTPKSFPPPPEPAKTAKRKVK